MAKAKFILVAFILCATALAQAGYKPQATASNILRVAAVKGPESLQLAYRKMATLLDKTAILVAPEGTEFTRCTENTLAYVMPAISRSIHLCRLALAQSEKAIAQTLIHEVAHLIGYMNECDATILEVTAMRTSGRGLAYENGYMAQCGL